MQRYLKFGKEVENLDIIKSEFRQRKDRCKIQSDVSFQLGINS
jgi:hypothetical protein